MNCEKIEELLSPYIEGELDTETSSAVKTHLQTCEGCASLLSFIQKTQESLSDFPELEVSHTLLERLHNIPTEKKRFNLGLDFFLRPSFQPIFAAATVFLTISSFYFFNPNKSQFDKALSRQLHLGYSKAEKLFIKAESVTYSLGEYKDRVLVSLKNINPLDKNGENNTEQRRF